MPSNYSNIQAIKNPINEKNFNYFHNPKFLTERNYLHKDANYMNTSRKNLHQRGN